MCVVLLWFRWATAMTSTIAGEETSSDGREVTMTAPESVRTDAETTGTTGQEN